MTEMDAGNARKMEAKLRRKTDEENLKRERAKARVEADARNRDIHRAAVGEMIEQLASRMKKLMRKMKGHKEPTALATFFREHQSQIRELAEELRDDLGDWPATTPNRDDAMTWLRNLSDYCAPD